MYVNQSENNNFWSVALAYKGSVTPLVLKQVLYIFVYSCVISIVNCVYPWFYLAIGPFEYAGFMLAVILVFRINCGYDRWWEARKLWGGIVNNSRNMATILTSFVRPREVDDLRQSCQYVSAIPYLIKNQLRQELSTEELKSLLSAEDIDLVAGARNRPLLVSTMLARQLNDYREHNQLDPMSFLKAEEQREAIIDHFGACERILKTPMPYVMAIKTKRFVLIFLLALPCALTEVSAILSPFITSLVAYAIFSIDQIAVQLQNPFSRDNLSHLPLDAICATIQRDVSELQAGFQHCERKVG